MFRSAIPSLCLLVFCVFTALPSAAPASDPAPTVPAHIEERFAAFASTWVESCQRSYTHNAKKRDVCTEQGSVIVRYTAIDPGSVSWRIRATSSKDSPFVGILTYHRNDMESRGQNRSEAEARDFIVTRAVKVTEIFRYSKGAWQQ
jgi:hypothetical protein